MRGRGRVGDESIRRSDRGGLVGFRFFLLRIAICDRKESERKHGRTGDREEEEEWSCVSGQELDEVSGGEVGAIDQNRP